MFGSAGQHMHKWVHVDLCRADKAGRWQRLPLENLVLGLVGGGHLCGEHAPATLQQQVSVVATRQATPPVHGVCWMGGGRFGDLSGIYVI